MQGCQRTASIKGLTPVNWCIFEMFSCRTPTVCFSLSFSCSLLELADVYLPLDCNHGAYQPIQINTTVEKFGIACNKSLFRHSQMNEGTMFLNRLLCCYVVERHLVIGAILFEWFAKTVMFCTRRTKLCTVVQPEDRKRQRCLWTTVKWQHKISAIFGKRNWKLSVKMCAD